MTRWAATAGATVLAGALEYVDHDKLGRLTR